MCHLHFSFFFFFFRVCLFTRDGVASRVYAAVSRGFGHLPVASGLKTDRRPDHPSHVHSFRGFAESKRLKLSGGSAPTGGGLQRATRRQPLKRNIPRP